MSVDEDDLGMGAMIRRMNARRALSRMFCKSQYDDEWYYSIGVLMAKMFGYESYQQLIDFDQSAENLRTMDLIAGPHGHAVVKAILARKNLNPADCGLDVTAPT